MTNLIFALSRTYRYVCRKESALKTQEDNIKQYVHQIKQVNVIFKIWLA